MTRRTDISPSDTLTIAPAAVCFIIIKAREFDAKVAPDDPESGSNPSDDRSIDVLEDFADDPTVQELAGAIDSLNEDQRCELLALCWIGRGDYAPEQWSEALTTARSTVDRKLTDYLLGTPLLGDYIEDGYSQLGYSCQEVEMGHL